MMLEIGKRREPQAGASGGYERKAPRLPSLKFQKGLIHTMTYDEEAVVGGSGLADAMVLF